MDGLNTDYEPIKSRVPPQDGRSADARLMRKTRDALINEIGEPNAVQVELVQQIAWVTLFIQRLNEKALSSGGTLSSADTRKYLSYSAIKVCALARLGLDTIPDADDAAELVNEVVAA